MFRFLAPFGSRNNSLALQRLVLFYPPTAYFFEKNSANIIIKRLETKTKSLQS